VVAEQLHHHQLEVQVELVFLEKEIMVVFGILELLIQQFRQVVEEELGLRVEQGLQHLVVLVATV
jgi:hypothetical protein